MGRERFYGDDELRQGIEAYTTAAKRHLYDENRRIDALKAQHPEISACDEGIARAGITFARACLGADDTQIAKAEAAYAVARQAWSRRRQEAIEAAGLTPEALTPRYQCDLCKDTGYVAGQMCTCLRAYLINRNASAFDLTADVRRSRFDGYCATLYPEDVRPIMQKIYHFLRQYCHDFSQNAQNLLFTGTVGTGKTFMCACVANALIEAGHHPIYVTAAHLVDAFRECYTDTTVPDASSRLSRRLAACDLLIIDDLGTEHSTAFSQNCLYQLIADRLLIHRPMIIATNLTVEGIMKAYDERLSSRIRGNFTSLPFKGQDIRQILKRMQRG